MKTTSKSKKTVLLAAALLAGTQLFAQTTDTLNTTNYVRPFSPENSFRTWSIGVHAGSVSGYTPFRGKDDWHTDNIKFGYGAYVKKQILPSWGIQANFFRGQLAGTDPAGTYGYTRFETDINYAADLSAVFTLANINWRHQQGVIQPYLMAGGGFTGYKPHLYTANGTERTVTSIKNGGSISEFYIPVGFGLKFNISQGINIDMGYQVNFMNSDNIDGYTYANNFDKFSYGHIGLEFALGKSSKPQLATHNPVASMRTEYLMKTNALQGELAAERARNEKMRNDVAAAEAANSARIAELNAKVDKFTADSDGDGVPDFYDKCPNTPAGTKVDGSGCPLTITRVVVTEADRKVVKEAIKNLEFDFGKATIRAHSFPSLDRVAELLINKNFSLKLAGHTDNVGSDDANMKLSKDRTESIKSYLVSKGANPSRIEATGYGETQPIASNKTAAGRQKNRRVEFTLY